MISKEKETEILMLADQVVTLKSKIDETKAELDTVMAKLIEIMGTEYDNRLGEHLSATTKLGNVVDYTEASILDITNWEGVREALFNGNAELMEQFAPKKVVTSYNPNAVFKAIMGTAKLEEVRQLNAKPLLQWLKEDFSCRDLITTDKKLEQLANKLRKKPGLDDAAKILDTTFGSKVEGSGKDFWAVDVSYIQTCVFSELVIDFYKMINPGQTFEIEKARAWIETLNELTTQEVTPKLSVKPPKKIND